MEAGGFAALLFLSPWHCPGAATGGGARHIPPALSIPPLLTATPTASPVWPSHLQPLQLVPLQETLMRLVGCGWVRPLSRKRELCHSSLFTILYFLKNSNFNPSIISLAKRHNEHFRKLLKVIIDILKMCIYIILIICQCCIHLSCSILTMFGENYHYHPSLLHFRTRKPGEVRSYPRSHSCVNGGVQT